MKSKKEGQRVGAILGTKKDEKIIEFFGFGVYEGDHVAGEGDPLPIGWISEMMVKYSRPNPRIRLDDGKIVWGCECWWGPEEQLQAKLKSYEEQGYSIASVDIDEVRKRFREEEQASQSRKPGRG